jgi:quercetin dioxygenase-like cupin family protein
VNGPGWETAHIDELESLPIDEEGLTWRPVRRRFGIEAFGVNAYTAEHAGQRVIEEHSEPEAHDELYFVAAGGATFTLDGEEVAAPAGTFVSVGPGTLRGAVASEPDTTVLAIGAKRGEVFSPSAWEPTFAAFGYLRLGEVQRGRSELRQVLEAKPEAWEGHYNLACYEARAGERDAAIEHLKRAVELGGERVQAVAAKDSDLDSIRDGLP